MLFNPIKPWYLYQPAQLFHSLRDRLSPAGAGFVTKRLAWGVSIRVRRHKVIGTGIIRNGVFDLAVSEVLYRLADPGEKALDIGANIGYMSSILGARLGSSGSLWSFEPHPELFDHLSSNVQLFASNKDFVPVRLCNTALSDQDGSALLRCPGDFASNEGTATLGPIGPGAALSTFTVATQRADTLFGSDYFGVVKLDVEGHELSVLRGASALLAEKRMRDIVFEDHLGPGSEVCALLEEYGYSIFRLGWGLKGPKIAPISSQAIHSRFDAPSYLATINPERAAARLSPRGWQLLSRRRTRTTR
jgi:FkbM family methyltransferase